MKIFINHPNSKDFTYDGHTISKYDYFDHLKNNRSLFDYVKHGLSSSSLFAKLRNPEYIHNLFLKRDKSYFNFLHEFKERYKHYDVIVMNPGLDLVHPEFLYENFKKSLKVLHLVDDPHTTYSYSFPFIWVFDAATYTTPSYSEKFSMAEILSKAGINNAKWIPNCFNNIDEPKYSIDDLKSQLSKRILKSFYIGGFYTDKMKRIIELKKSLGNLFDIYGKFPLKGYSYFLYSLLLKNPSFAAPKTLNKKRWDWINENYSVGINLHLTMPSVEVGNARLFELPYRGVCQLCDISSISKLPEIFEPDKEILTYKTIDECIEKTKIILNDHELRNRIALAGYKKAIEKYNYYKVLNSEILWFKSLI